MVEKFVNKSTLTRLVAVLLTASILILTLSILGEPKDGRRQIIDGDGGEEQLCMVLSSMKGVGAVDVMIEYDADSNVKGVIVTAEGGGSPVVVNDITNGVATLYDIPVSSVIVFEKEQEE